MAKKSRHQIALEERVEELRAKERTWADKAAEYERYACGCEATRCELQAILDSVDSGEQETEEA